MQCLCFRAKKQDEDVDVEEQQQPTSGSGGGSSGSSEETSSTSQTCNNCAGKFVNTNAKFCHNCGTHRQYVDMALIFSNRMTIICSVTLNV